MLSKKVDRLIEEQKMLNQRLQKVNKYQSWLIMKRNRVYRQLCDEMYRLEKRKS